MSYTKDFKPNNGDRVSFRYVTSEIKGRVVGYNESQVTVKHCVHGYHRKEWSDVIFLRRCPWWKFWQKWR